MSFRAHDLSSVEHESQNVVERKVHKKLMKKLMIHQRLDAIAEEVLPDVLPYAGGDEKRARKIARRWAYESLCMYVYHHLDGGDVVFLE